MRKNKLKEKLKKGDVLIGTAIMECRSPNLAQLFAAAGFDWLFIDSEHSSFSIETIASFVVSCKAADIGSIFRVPSKEHVYWITRYLDSGTQGIVVPHVETKQNVTRIIEAAKYYPSGKRGIAFELAHNDFQIFEKPSNITESANQETFVGIQIESIEAAERIDELISVEGVDFAFIGPWDLSQSVGIPGEVKDAKVVKIISSVVRACKNHGVICGIAVGNDIDMAKNWIKEGVKMILISSDVGLIVEGGSIYTEKLKHFIRRNTG
ncbi:hypothetical protein IBX65_01915 [Candidatus Aerophobetes bacterium]|nr:hypothetical protein [Candidatus Aerophobetes bacterium]